MNYCPNCGEKLPQAEAKHPLQPGLPIPPADHPTVLITGRTTTPPARNATWIVS